MHHKHVPKIFIFGGMLLIVTIGAYAFYSVKSQLNLLKQMVVKFLGVKVLSANMDSVGLTVYLSIVNISELELEIDSISMDVSLDGIAVNKIVQNKKQLIPAQTSGKVEFDLYFKPMDLIGGVKISTILKAFDYKNIMLRLVGTVSGAISGIPFSNQPFDISETIGDLMSNTPPTT